MSNITPPPRGITLFAHEWAAIWPVQVRECGRLYYPDVSAIVPYVAEIIIEYSDGRQFAAECYAETLKANGYHTITLCERVTSETGCPVG